nr:FumA C-terminus/TtdB family hydratase beta subunit [uncultured Sphaerochaeta sp.]
MRELVLPISQQDILSLQPYEQVLVSGKLYVGRDQVHKLLASLLEENQPLPIGLEGACIYYMGPSPAPEGRVIGSCGPTTSARMDPFAPLLLDHGLKVMIGKGPRSKQVVEAIKRNQALYLQAYGGCGALYASCVRSARTVAFAELGPEALLELEVEQMPVVVAITATGASVFDR